VKSLFRWAKRSRHGLLLFVDEAETFLEDRKSLSREKIRVLNEWISQTGTETKNFMTVYATNRPEVLDSAVLSRVTRCVELGPPGPLELERIIKQTRARFLAADVKTVSPYTDREAANMMFQSGLVGRDVVNLFIQIEQELSCSQNKKVLSWQLFEQCLYEIVAKNKLINSIQMKQ